MNKKTFLLLYFIIFGLLFGLNGTKKMEVRVYFRTADELFDRLGEFFSELDIATGGETENGESYIVIITTEEQLQRIKEKGLRVEITYPDIKEKFRLITGVDPDKPELLRDFGYFFTYWEMQDTLNKMKTNFPAICSLINIGNSYQGRPLWTLKISDNPRIDEPEPAVYINGAIHAREPGATHCCIDFASYLLMNYGQDSLITWLVNNREIFITPVQNPDGYVYNSDSGGPTANWRKNRRRVGGGDSVGIDLNRNFGYRWGYDNTGSSPNPTSETYRGPYRFSEIETQVIRDFMLPQKIRTQMDYHTYGRYNMFPWGYRAVWPPDTAVLREGVDTFRMYNGYPASRTGQLSRVLYTANGVSVDWEYADTAGKFRTYAFTIEMCSLDFWQGWDDSAYIHNECRRNRPNNLYLTRIAGVFFEPRQVFINDSLNGNRTLQLDPGETASVWFRVRNRAIHPLDSAYAVSGKLKSLDPMVIVLDSIKSFPRCRRRDSTDNRTNQFRFYCLPQAEPGRNIPLRLELTYLNDGQTMTQAVNFSITIGSNPIVLHDVGVIAISSPTGVLDSGITITPACTVYNFGGTTENYTVRMKIGTFYDQTATVSNHQPLTKIYLTFPVWNADQLGTHLVSCSTRLSNDMVLSNDRQTGSVEVRRIGIKDVGCTKILMPTGIIDSGMVITPACSVYNYGNTVETYTVRMKIGIDYNYTATVINHTPLTYRYLTFPNWFASPRGKIAVTCTTELSGDNQPGNDKKIDSVFVQVLDVSPIEILAPIDTIDLGSVITPQIKVKNFGNITVSFNTFLLIGDYAAEMVVSELLPDEERIISFSDWTAEPAGEISVKCTTQLFGDQINENDKIIGSVYVRVLDVGVIEILAPSDTVDSGMAITPKAKIKNFGSEPASFGVIFQISDYYSMREISALSPDKETIIDFDLWLPEMVGDFLAQCSTMLNGDVQPENNCQRKIVNVRPKIPTIGWVKVTDLPLLPSNKRIKSGGLIVSGGNKIYIVKGNNTKDFYSFIPENAITQLDSVPITGKKGVKKGTGMVYDGTKYLYFASGTNTLQFWRYDTETNAWESLPPIPAGGGKALKGGTGMAYVNGFVYLLKGSKTNEFYAFDCTNNTWIETLPKAPEGTYIGKGYSDGSCLIAYDDNTLYALRGKYNEFYKYDISANTWEKDSGMPFTHPMWNKKKKVGEGASMTLKSGKIYAFKGNNTKEFWSFDPTTKWAGLETIPKMPDKKYVKGGGGLCTWTDGTIYALKGNNTLSIWKYTGEDLTLALPSSNIGTQELSRKTFIQINSNPTKGLTKVYYNLPKKELATLKVYNILGNLVYSAKSEKGEFTIKRVPAGIYLLRFESKGYKEERKLIVVK